MALFFALKVIFLEEVGHFHYIRGIMKKIVRFLLLIALAFTVAGTVIVSCQIGDGEEDVPEVGEGGTWPIIRPRVFPSGIASVSKQTAPHSWIHPKVILTR